MNAIYIYHANLNHFFSQLSVYTYYLSIPIPSKFILINNNILNTNLIIKNNKLDYTYFELVDTILEAVVAFISSKKNLLKRIV